MSGRSLLLPLAATAVLALLTAAVVAGHGPVQDVDRHVQRVVLHHQLNAAHRLADLLTTVVSPVVDIAALLGVVVLRRRQQLAAATATVLGLVGVVLALKYGVGRAAPDGTHQARGVFPSGHTASVLVCTGAGVLLLGPPAGPRRRALLAAVAAVTAVVAACLLYIDAHWLSDLVAGAACGVTVLWLLAEAQAEVRRPATGR